MSTTSKGKDFELRVLSYLREWVHEGQSPYQPDCCEIFHQKAYHSKDRGGDIKFDIAIEVRSRGRENPSIINLIECKDLGAQVTIDDVEEFWAKIQQIRSVGCKGIFASTAGFNKTVLNYARNKGIGIIRFLNEGQVQWLLDRSPGINGLDTRISTFKIIQALTETDFESNWIDVFAMSGSLFTESLYDFFAAHLPVLEFDNELEFVPRKEPILRVPFVEDEEIEAICSSIHSNIGYQNGAVSLDDVCDWRSSSSDLKVTEKHLSVRKVGRSEVLGSIRFWPTEITLHINSRCARGRFTLAHELGHDILEHGQYLLVESHSAWDEIEKIDSRMPVPQDVRRLEWQANRFASSLLLPRKEFSEAFLKACQRIDLRRRGYGHLFVDDQDCNQKHYYQISSLLADEFHVSLAVVKLRLKALRLINAQSNLRRVGC